MFSSSCVFIELECVRYCILLKESDLFLKFLDMLLPFGKLSCRSQLTFTTLTWIAAVDSLLFHVYHCF